MISRKAPLIRDFDKLDFPVISTEEIKNVNGDVITLNKLLKGKEPVCRLTIVWEKNGIPQRRADDLIMAAMLREGCEGFSGEQIEDILDFNGAWMTIENNYSHIALNLYCLTERLTAIIPILKNIITQPTFPRSSIELIKDKEVDNIKLQKLQVSYVADKELNSLIYGKDNPLSKIITEAEIKAVERRQLLESFDRCIRLSFPSIWVSGNVDENMMEHVRDFCREIIGEKRNKRRTPDFQNGKDSSISHIRVPIATQCAVYMGIAYPGIDENDFLDLKIASTILGGYFGSRLNNTVREDEGLTYGIHSAVSRISGGACFKLNAQTTKENVDSLIRLSKQQIGNMGETGIEKQELDDMRRYTMSVLANLIESPFNLLDLYISLKLGHISSDYLFRYQDRLFSITSDEINKISAKYINPENLAVVVAGNI